MDRQYKVTFEPQGRTVTVLAGTKVVEAAARAGLTIDCPCGGLGTCGKCRVQVTRGAAEPTAVDRARLGEELLAESWRLACQMQVHRDCAVRVPESSLFGSTHQILMERQKGAAAEVQPAVRKVYVELPQPTLEDGAADLLRVEQKIGRVHARLSLLRRLPGLLRAANFKGTAVLTDHRMIDFEPGDTTGSCHGIAFDIGTTTIVGSLLDLRTGNELAIASAINPQVNYGDDVVSRIKHSGSCDECLDQLRKAALATVIELLDSVCKQAGLSRRSIYEATFAGNTTMQHLLCGIESGQLGQVPFVPAYAGGLLLDAAEMELPIHPRGMAFVFPVIGGFVGGDTVAGMLATNLAQLDGPVLLVDIGTNGEIVLAHDGKLLAASTAAGPAFEGARISCGMRAATGAIEKVILDGDVRLGAIGNAEPIGLCGSGLIDVAAELLRRGIVSPEGRMVEPDELPADLAPSLKARLVKDSSGQPQFILHEGEGGKATLAITQRDVRELQLATGAIRAGIRILLQQAHLKPADLKKVLVAGGFGSFIRRSNAQRIGLLPPELHHEKVTYVGNASLNGAKWALLSTDARRRADELARRTRHVELSLDMNFQMEFAEAMIFPQSE